MGLYVREKYEHAVDERVIEFLREYSLALLISCTKDGPFLSHLPILVEGSGSSIRVFRGHLAKGNPHYEILRRSSKCTMIFNGPNAYMSPRWYEPPFVVERKSVTPRFPTWNYVAVEVTGMVEFSSSDADTDRVLDDTIEYFERRNGTLWDSSSYPDDRRNMMRAGLAAFEMVPEMITPKFKLSQYYEVDERLGSILGLYSKGTGAEQAIARLMHEALTKKDENAG